VFEDTIDEIDGHLITAAPNAYFNPRTNEYHIALDGIGQAYMYFAVHESVHDIAANSRLGYERLEELVLDTLREKGEVIDALVAVQKQLHPGQDEAYWREEVVANTVPVILTDKQTGIEFARRFANESEDTRNVFEKILDAIRDFLQRAYDVLRQEKSWRQMESVKSDMDALEAIRTAYFDALEETAGAEAGEGEARMSARLDPNFADKVNIDANYRKVARMDPVAELSGNEFAKGDIDLVTQVASFFEEKGGIAHNPMLGDIQLTRRGVKDDTEHGFGRNKAIAFAAVPDVIEKGEIIDFRHNWKGRGYDTVVVAAPIKIAGAEFMEGVVLLKDVNTDRFYLHEVLAKRKSADSPFKTGATPWSALPGGKSAPFIISILQKVFDYKTSIRKTGENDTPIPQKINSAGTSLKQVPALFKDKT